MNHQTSNERPKKIGGHWVWQASGVRTRICLVGRGPETQLQRILSLLAGSPGRAARLRQVHSSSVVQASEGLCGEADALFTGETDLAMGVATADCLPIVLSGQRQSAAVHAGWRGLESGILGRTLECLTDPGEDLEAWIGPGIGPCCYEVGQDVANRVAGSSSSEVIVEQRSGAVHLDLMQAARFQLSAAGVQEIVSLPVCTYCEVEKLWSYRREGPRAGRNWTLAWRTPKSAI
ncbi:MAG: peptidoglycan editing factor PgeF [Thermoanaerobaculia bacterium]